MDEKAAFRRWARENHPDVGGDPAVFAAGLQAAREGRWVEPEPAAEQLRRTELYLQRSARSVIRLVIVARGWTRRGR